MSDPTNDWWSTHPIAAVLLAVLRAIGTVVGIFLLVVSIPLFVTPIPLGLPLFILSLIILAATSRKAHEVITGYLKRHPKLWKRVSRFFGGDADDPGQSKGGGAGGRPTA